jgi:uncharacterized membrane protein YccC
MNGYTLPTGEHDPIHLVRTISRLAQMLLEIRDEYISDPRPDTLDQFERRLDEISTLQRQLRELRASLDERSAAGERTA